MKGLIEIHTTTYRRLYKKLTSEFIESYCHFRKDGYNAQDALQGAKISVQNQVALQIVGKNDLESKTIVTAYQNLKKDATLIETAIRYYQESNE